MAGGRGAVVPRRCHPLLRGGAADGVRGSDDVRVVRPHGYAWRPALSRPSPVPSSPLPNHRRRHGFGRREEVRFIQGGARRDCKVSFFRFSLLF